VSIERMIGRYFIVLATEAQPIQLDEHACYIIFQWFFEFFMICNKGSDIQFT
jgi:hypothetical protein